VVPTQTACDFRRTVLS